jgi:hypothetical protein
MGDDIIDRMRIRDLHQEDGASELASSPDMEPYVSLAAALLQGADAAAELSALRQLPLEQRYVWRVASALKWAFADFDDLGVKADRATLVPQDLGRVVELLKVRPVQFCMFLKALLGADEMQRVMIDAIRVAKRT